MGYPVNGTHDGGKSDGSGVVSFIFPYNNINNFLEKVCCLIHLPNSFETRYKVDLLSTFMSEVIS